MSEYLKSFQLLNFQSWSNASPSMNLCTDTLNIIEGPNETGKSVFFKVFYNMVFPGYWSSSELIRRGYTTAAMILYLADDSQVVYTLERGHHAVILQNSEGEEQVWRDYSVFPAELINHLGLVIDFQSKVILNIIDKDVPLPFIKSSPTLNASHFKAIVEPPDITEFFESLKVKLSDAEYARSLFSRAATSTYAAASVLDFVDINKLNSELSFVDTMLSCLRIYDNLLDNLSAIIGKVNDKPIEVKNPENLQYSLLLYDSLQESSTLVESVISIQQSKPSCIANPAVVIPVLRAYDSLDNLITKIHQVTSYYMTKPLEVMLPKGLDNELSSLDKLVKTTDLLSQLNHYIDKAPQMITLPTITAEISLFDLFSLCLNNINNIVSKQTSIMSIKREQLAISDEIKRIQDTVGVCPTCGRLLEEHIE